MSIKTLGIYVDPEFVVIENTKVPRPKRIAVSEWLKFWEKIIKENKYDWRG